MRHVRLAITGLVFVTAATIPLTSLLAQSELNGMTVDRAVERALDHPLRRQIRRAEADGQRAAARSERLWPNPTFAWAREHVWETASESAGEDDLVLEQELPITGAKRASHKRALAEKRAATMERRMEKIELETKVRRIFFDALHAEKTLKVWRDQLRAMEKGLDKLRASANRGEVAQIDVVGFEQQLAEVRVDRSEVRTSLRRAGNRLATFASRSNKVTGGEFSLDGKLLPGDSPPPFAKLRDRAAERPDLRALRARATAASRAGDAARRSGWPTPSLTGGYKRIDTGEGGSLHGFIVGLSFPLGISDRGQWENREAAARKRRLDSRLALVRERIDRRISGLRRTAVDAVERANSYRSNVLERAKKVYGATKSAHESGEASLTEMLDAHVALFEARRRALELEHGARMRRIELNSAAGIYGGDGN